MPNISQNGGPVYQTLSEFYMNPFGVALDERTELEQKYTKFKTLISIDSYSNLNDSYFIRIKVPSESQPGKKYDVIIQFIPKDKNNVLESNLDNYVLQFFSNSPSFVYRYAALYKKEGYMINALESKLDPKYADVLPENTNKEMKLRCDKSLFFAIKFLYDGRITYLSKRSLRYQRHLAFKQFIDSIDDNPTALKKTAYDIEKEAIKEGKVDEKKIEKFIRKRLQSTTNRKISPSTSTVKNLDGSTYHSNVNSGKAPMRKKGKVTAKRSTKR